MSRKKTANPTKIDTADHLTDEFDDELDDDGLELEPDFDEFGNDDFDLEKLEQLDKGFSQDDADALMDEFDDEYTDEFGERPPRKPKKVKNTNALIATMPTALTAPGVNLGAYINAVHQIPILTPEQEQDLAHRYYDEGDVEADSVTRYVAFTFCHSHRSQLLGLWLATGRFNPRRQRGFDEGGKAF